jgi:hypothetical protein
MISPRAYAIVIFMTATTTLFAPPVLRVLFRKAPTPAVPAASQKGAAQAGMGMGDAVRSEKSD